MTGPNQDTAAGEGVLSAKWKRLIPRVGAPEQHVCEPSDPSTPHLWPQDPDDHCSELLVLASEFPHLVQASLQLPVGGVDPPHHLQVLFPLSFDDVSQQHLKLLILIVPSLEHFEASDHDLGQF